jgi:hypothetical protein
MSVPVCSRSEITYNVRKPGLDTGPPQGLLRRKPERFLQGMRSYGQANPFRHSD